jgi:hypothetical protein
MHKTKPGAEAAAIDEGRADALDRRPQLAAALAGARSNRQGRPVFVLEIGPPALAVSRPTLSGGLAVRNMALCSRTGEIGRR